MKIRFLKKYIDPGNPVKEFLPGSTAEVTEPDGLRLIEGEIAEQIDPETRAKKTGVIMTECVPVDFADTQKQQKKK